MMYGLPFLYGWKWYTWAREFFESTNKLNFLCAGNQLSKSSSQIRKCIDWATNQAKWVQLWASEPNQFWYLYPSQDVVNAEFATKWKQFLPRGRYKEDSYYGWKEMKKGKDIIGIQFNSGVMVLFKTYSKNPQHLQTGTCYAIFCFVAGTKIETDRGSVNIEDIKVGDMVLTHDGFRRVKKTMNKKSEVITRKFSNGSEITGTYDHPFWTQNRGWVQYGQLTENDILITVPECKNISRSYYLTDRFTKEHQSTKISEKEIISEEMGHIFTLSYGSNIIRKTFLMDMSFIIRMKTHLITGLKILNALVEKSIQGFISYKNGKIKKRIYSNVINVEKNLHQEAVKEEHQDFAHKNVEDHILRLNAKSAEIKKKLEKNQNNCFVLKDVQIQQKHQIVYNLELEENNTYFANGILVHNCDEELPVHIYDELVMRINATDGFFHMVFTATIGQEFWRKVMEPRSPDEEELKGSAKWTVSAYDCMFYEDGTASHWTKERIAALEAKCKNRTEVLKRVYGRFVMDVGLKYPTFQADRHLVKGHPIPSSWFIYAGVDLGSGGKSGHPAAICFTAVKPDFKQARVFLAWRGDGIETTDGDIWNKYVQLVREHKLNVTTCYYDFASKDFEIIAGRSDYAVIKAEKGHEKGEQMINTMFKHDMVLIYENEETAKLANELSSLLEGKNKRACKDDLIDAFRYSISSLPIDFSGITSIVSVEEKETIEKPLTEMQKEIAERRKQFMEKGDQDGDIEAEFNYWNDLYN